MKVRLYIWTLFILISCPFIAQVNDSSTVLSFDEYMRIVKEHHPLAKQAELQSLLGDAALLEAKGGFDPQLFTNISQKYFEDKQYYSRINGGLQVPTWFGVELRSGYEQNQGEFLNPEANTPGNGLWYAGISVPVGQGLFIDKRRTELRKARVFAKSTEAIRTAMLNELLFEAGKAYWDWFIAYNDVLVYTEALEVARLRLEAVKQSAVLGDRPEIDTLEAGIQVQNRMLGLQETQLLFANTSALLGIYLWDEGVIPLEIAPGTVPVLMDSIVGLPVNNDFQDRMDTLIADHPQLNQYQYKIDQMEIDRQMKQEQLKPTLNLNYNPISAPVGGDAFTSYSISNYTWGLEFKFPVLLRAQRGQLRKTDLKIREAQLDLQNKRELLLFKARTSLNDWNISRQQIELYAQTVEDYQGLLTGERQMFNAGESSLFMVNSRELGYINAKLKLIELLAKNRKASLTANYAFGLLGD